MFDWVLGADLVYEVSCRPSAAFSRTLLVLRLQPLAMCLVRCEDFSAPPSCHQEDSHEPLLKTIRHFWQPPAPVPAHAPAAKPMAVSRMFCTAAR